VETTPNIMFYKESQRQHYLYCVAASSSGSSQVTRGRLMETVAKAHDNVLELVKHGVVQADEIISPKSTLPVSMAAPVSQSGSEYMGKAGDSAAPLKLETVESEDEFPSTPRTQAIFNMSSDEEHFSPPVYVKAKPGKFVLQTFRKVLFTS